MLQEAILEQTPAILVAHLPLAAETCVRHPVREHPVIGRWREKVVPQQEQQVLLDSWVSISCAYAMSPVP